MTGVGAGMRKSQIHQTMEKGEQLQELTVQWERKSSKITLRYQKEKVERKCLEAKNTV